MLNVPESIKRLYLTDGINKNFRVHFPNGEYVDLTNKDIVEGSVKFTESICSKDVLQFGLSEESSIEFECVGVPNVFGAMIECGNEIDITSLTSAEIQEIQDGDFDGTLVLSEDSDIAYGYYRIPYGVFTIRSCPQSHSAMSHREVSAYSEPVVKKSISIFSQYVPFSKVLIPERTLRGITTNDWSEYTCTEMTGNEYTGVGSGHVLYDKQKKYVTLTLKNATGIMYDLNVATAAVITSDISTEEIENYEKIGLAVAKYLDDNGYDLTYNKNGKKVFTTNEDAVRACAGHYFAPCIASQTVGGYETYDRKYYAALEYASTPINSNKPIIHAGSAMATKRKSAYVLDGWGVTSLRVRKISHMSANCELIISGEDTYVSSPINVDEFTSSAKLYRYSRDEEDIKIDGIVLNSTLKTKGYFTATGRTDSDGKAYKDISVNGNSFVNAVSFYDVYNGWLEARGKFAKRNRHGGIAEVSLSKTRAQNVTKDMYSQLWFDEYDIDDIGTVKYSFGNGENIGTVTIGDGKSLYDMTKNEYFDNMYAEESDDGNSIKSKIDAMLNEEFKKNAMNINFTPVNMTMIGLPYLEAGDLLKISGENGTIIETYMLHRELSGVQTLFDDVESKGGEVLEDE